MAAYTGPFPHTNTKTITSISATNTSFTGNIGNTGKIETTLTTAIEIVGGSVGGIITNSGTISAGFYGIRIIGNADIGAVGSGGITNSGHIVTGGASSGNQAIWLSGDATFIGNIVN